MSSYLGHALFSSYNQKKEIYKKSCWISFLTAEHHIILPHSSLSDYHYQSSLQTLAFIFKPSSRAQLSLSTRQHTPKPPTVTCWGELCNVKYNKSDFKVKFLVRLLSFFHNILLCLTFKINFLHFYLTLLFKKYSKIWTYCFCHVGGTT